MLTQRVDNRTATRPPDMRREADKIKHSQYYLNHSLKHFGKDANENKAFCFSTEVSIPQCFVRIVAMLNGKHCSIALTYHRTDGYPNAISVAIEKPTPRRCSECNSFDLHKRGHGTQKIEDLVAELLPRRTIIRRIDADIMTKIFS